jgi:hypothetical protein
MPLTSLATSLKAALNRSNPNSLASMLKSVLFGDVLRREPTQLRAVALTLDPYGPASNTSIVLPDDAKCEVVLAGYARTGTGATRQLIPQPPGAAVGTAGYVAPSANGNIAFYPTDAFTSVDVLYIPKHIHVLEVTLPVATGVVTLPTGVGTACELLEAQRADTSTANLVVTVPAATNSSTGTACFDLAKTHVLLVSADAATSVRLKLGVVDPVDINALLEATSAFI